ncbi:glycosyltransferase family 2 protein [Hymenobacter psoromatis]|uniref:glycosyltransferase family 2 protein n=1 Tax=Hymenobacter psoromatis TaxID=1484116 RepID=UPI001CBB00A6|nr:glycosyltransferase family A protein [Hymenobacter psoromatis]
MRSVKPFFSVIIPTYNRADLIGKTLESVRQQEFATFEVLVVDDGSRDHTAEIVQPFLADLRFHYLLKQNAERGAARNYGLDHAQGEYAVFLDSDDLFHPEHLATLHAAIEASPTWPNFIATKYDFDRAGRRRPSDLAFLPTGPLGFDTFLQGNALACNVCVRRENPDLRRFEEDRRYAAIEDWMFMLENTQHGDAVQLVDALTLTMNDHDQRSMRADNQGFIRRLELAVGWMQQHLTLTAAQRQVLLGRLHYLCAIHAHIDGYQAQALRFAWRAMPGLPGQAGAALLLRCATPPGVVQWAKRLLGR